MGKQGFNPNLYMYKEKTFDISAVCLCVFAKLVECHFLQFRFESKLKMS